MVSWSPRLSFQYALSRARLLHSDAATLAKHFDGCLNPTPLPVLGIFPPSPLPSSLPLLSEHILTISQDSIPLPMDHHGRHPPHRLRRRLDRRLLLPQTPLGKTRNEHGAQACAPDVGWDDG